ncbi:MAG: hypothetical protein WCJ58_00690 [bacterium]
MQSKQKKVKQILMLLFLIGTILLCGLLFCCGVITLFFASVFNNYDSEVIASNSGRYQLKIETQITPLDDNDHSSFYLIDKNKHNSKEFLFYGHIEVIAENVDWLEAEQKVNIYYYFGFDQYDFSSRPPKSVQVDGLTVNFIEIKGSDLIISKSPNQQFAVIVSQNVFPGRAIGNEYFIEFGKISPEYKNEEDIVWQGGYTKTITSDVNISQIIWEDETTLRLVESRAGDVILTETISLKDPDFPQSYELIVKFYPGEYNGA